MDEYIEKDGEWLCTGNRGNKIDIAIVVPLGA